MDASAAARPASASAATDYAGGLRGSPRARCALREQLASCLPQLSARICFLTVDWYLPAVSKSLTVGAVPAEPAGTVN